jgi:hypothetical protein
VLRRNPAKMEPNLNHLLAIRTFHLCPLSGSAASAKLSGAGIPAKYMSREYK